MAGIAKSTTTPTHMTTLPDRSHLPYQESTVGFIKRFTSSAAKPPHQIPEPNGTKESPCRISKPDRKTVVPICSAFGIYWKSLSDLTFAHKSLQCLAKLET